MPTPAGYKGYGGPAPRKTLRTLVFALVVLVVVATIVVYAIATVTAPEKQGEAAYLTPPGIPCNDSKLPADILQIEQNTVFLAVSGGSCYNYIEGNATSSVTGNQTLTFNLYNGTAFYPCGVAPEPLIANQIRASLNGSLGVEYVELNTDVSSLNDIYNCSSSAPAVGVVSVQYIEVTIPAVPEVNVTLYSPQGGEPVIGLTAALAFEGSNYTISFGATQANPVLPGHDISAIQVVNQAVENATQIFPMRITGTFLDGQTFGYDVEVIITSTYAS